MPTVKFVKEKKSIEVPEGTNLRKAAMKAGVEVYQGVHKVLHCPGLGMCTTCMVHITKGADNISPPGVWEKMNAGNLVLHPISFLSRLGQEKEMRLSCQTTVLGDIEVETQPEFNWHGEKFWG